MKKTMFVAVAIAASVFALAGCSKKAEEAKGVELTINNGTEPQSLDPSMIQGVPEHRIYMALFEGLVSYDPKTSAAVPGVAESWSRSGENNEILTFKLRKTTWSDGTPITAQTFVDSWLYYMAPSTAAEYAYMPAAIIKGAEAYNAGEADASTVGLRAVDDYTFEVTLVGAVPYAEDMMGHYAFAPLPLHAIEANGSEWTKPGKFVGNGPFVLESWTPNEKITVVPNEKYWDKDNIFLSRITFLPIENSTTSYNKFKNGEIDWDTQIPIDMIDSVKYEDEFQTYAYLASSYYEFNLNDPTLSDVRVRKALNMGIDKQGLVDKVLKGGQIVANTFCPPMGSYVPPEGNKVDIEKAKSLLAEAGYPNGEGFPTLTLSYNTADSNKRVAEYIQAQLKENLGINIELENMEWKVFLSKRQSNDFQIARAGWVGDYADPSNFLELLLSTSGNNDGRYNNPEYDALLKQASTMPAGEERNAVLYHAEEICMTQDQAYITTHYSVSQNMIDLSKWDGWYNNTQDIHPYKGLKLKK